MKTHKIETARKAGSGVTMNLEVYCSNEETARTVANWLAAAARNCGVGHSATVAAFFDGDGADFIEVKGLPENDGAAMADACGNWGDGLMAHIGPYSAQAYNTSYADVNGETVEALEEAQDQIEEGADEVKKALDEAGDEIEKAKEKLE
jgi:hypothetical protein